jgi:hypothetical protein
MKPTIFSVLALTAGLGTYVSALAPPNAQGALIEATGKNFSELVKSQVPVMVKFVASCTEDAALGVLCLFLRLFGRV